MLWRWWELPHGAVFWEGRDPLFLHRMFGAWLTGPEFWWLLWSCKHDFVGKIEGLFYTLFNLLTSENYIKILVKYIHHFFLNFQLCWIKLLEMIFIFTLWFVTQLLLFSVWQYGVKAPPTTSWGKLHLMEVIAASRLRRPWTKTTCLLWARQRLRCAQTWQPVKPTHFTKYLENQKVFVLLFNLVWFNSKIS